ncbi:MAG: hypothetical protein A2600_10310 [Candidatus Lambdaproteobacteria bacterium RIFOXYD1_FULL_56_27]|uniref:AB hydrolase-1 domain-containing protein n=1 Tax=Candidatus Lambdaproteobacteria bacterium RIFOXYD2_FULL_56_26 TaxID=1817773 RepID=A0A1F6GQF1_9PROT|nr:MAG: hypothetical protein A2557_09375 [Candidatus Lambdaproteobacteria bacterium RIFOXYD2_FULL_56_26]OGH04141.1 MAG: hypothetical protein A2426_02765 [Candidatus Lambdaproteobacteria bacterium RIFOXYC1_FULL_56_13]OGH06342.1 MAG: hypothetical protein A2600_10310 [Candidatus Lambdaproteobacteria bacterium RIFOXYD1_FULL_56_27]
MPYHAGLDEVLVPASPGREAVPLRILYPTLTPAGPTSLGPFLAEVAPQAPVAEGRFPLVLFSHGSGSSSLLFRSLARFLAQNGFVVGLPEHPGNNRNDNERAQSLKNLKERPKHLKSCLDYFLGTDDRQSHLLGDQVAVIGHSIGAYTGLALAGGTPHNRHEILHFPEFKITGSEPIEVEADPRVKALVLLAPAVGWFMAPEALEKVRLPILMLTGELDTLAPSFHGEIVKGGVAGRCPLFHQTIPKAGHYSFFSPFPEAMRRPNFLPALDPEGFDREQFQEWLQLEVLGFLRRYLCGEQQGETNPSP